MLSKLMNTPDSLFRSISERKEEKKRHYELCLSVCVVLINTWYRINDVNSTHAHTHLVKLSETQMQIFTTFNNILVEGKVTSS